MGHEVHRPTAPMTAPNARPALVIVAHGSKTADWNAAVVDFARDVAASPGVGDTFATVQAAFIEGQGPRLPDVVRLNLSSGCPEVVVMPLFLTVSAHAGEDVPGLLGLPVPQHVHQRLVAEGNAPLSAGLPVRLVSPGKLEDLLLKNVLRRTSLQSHDRRHEAVVLCAYGSTIHHEAWEALLHGLRTRLMQAGFGHATHAYVGHVVGMSPGPAAQAIVDSARTAGVRRVMVVPLLISVAALQEQIIAGVVADAERRTRLPIIYAADAILPDGDLAAHFGFAALEALGVFPMIGDRRTQA